MWGLFSGDTPWGWEDAGFRIKSTENYPDDWASFEVGDYTIFFVTNGNRNYTTQGLLGWAWRDSNRAPNINGINLVCDLLPVPSSRKEPHPNGVVSLDHIVLKTNNLFEIEVSFEEAQIPLKKVVVGNFPGITQLFYRLDGAGFIEVVGPSETRIKSVVPNTVHRLWGIGFVVEDISHLKEFMKENVSEIRVSKQSKDRNVVTLRHNNFRGLTTHVLFITPHSKKT